MTPGHGASDMVLAAVVAAVAAAALGAARRGGRAGGRRTATAVLAAACVAACAALVPLPALGRHEEVVKGRHVDPPETDPLSRLRQWSDLGGTPVLHASFAAPPGEAARLWPVLAYDAYSATAGWQSSPRLTALPASAAGADRVDVRLAHAERLVPHPSGVRSVTPDGARFDGHTQALRLPRAAVSYTVAFTAPNAAPARPLAVPAATACPGAELRSLTARVDRSAPLDEQLAALERFLAVTMAVTPYDTSGPPDDGCRAVAAALRDGRGSGDQLATAFALAARMLGVSSRVVAGFAPRRAVGPDGRLDILGGDAAAWPQVATVGGAWADYWPGPAATAGDGAAGRGSAVTDDAARERPPAVRPPRGASSPWLLPALVAVALAALSTAAAAAARTRRRRQAEAAAAEHPDPRARVLASWQRALRTSRQTAGPATTARDVAESSASGPLRDLAELVDRVLYVPSARAGDADAARAADLAAAAARPSPGAEPGRGRGRRR